ncbi:MAG: HAD-IIB family hydrolase [Alphaproteobacteria bacterium]|nr:HAD-IIB family hydrolase [Alphaproteobacteria bacterium]
MTIPKAMLNSEANPLSANPSDRPVIVFTDLDGTLLDHNGYSLEAAKPALTALGEKNIKVVPTTSKTLAELDALMPVLGLTGGAIGENGAVIRFDDGEIDCVLSRPEIAMCLARLPDKIRAAMQCFCDMTTDEIAALTGLDPKSAAQAGAREASEPFLWHGAPSALTELQQALAADDLQVTQGGRFFHIVPLRDKAAAMNEFLARLLPLSEQRPEIWALGDGPNDVAMLLAADRAALIANRHLDTQSLLPPNHNLHVTAREGAAGWRDAIAVLLGQDFG